MTPFLRFLLFLRPGARARAEGERDVRWVGSNNKKSLFLLSPSVLSRPSARPKTCPAEHRPGHRYFPRFLLFLTPAGTAVGVERRAFPCPDFPVGGRRVIPMHTCEQCSKPFESKHRRHGRFCSRACANARGLAKPIRGILPRPCQQCGRVFKPHHRGQPGLFCSGKCAGLGKTKVVPVRQCVHCGRDFQRPGKQRFCSTVCASRWRGIQHRTRLEGPPAWKQRHREFSRDYKLVHKALASGELTLPEGWAFTDDAVQQWLRSKREAVEREREQARQYAGRSGWPDHLGPRRVQILNLLAHLGVPVRVKQMATALGIGPSSVRKQLDRLLRQGWVIGLGLSRAQTFTLGPTALSVQQERLTWERSNTES